MKNNLYDSLKQIQDECNRNDNCSECSLYKDVCVMAELLDVDGHEPPMDWNLEYMKENLERICKVIDKHNKEAKQ